jgi:hypothetical protein
MNRFCIQNWNNPNLVFSDFNYFLYTDINVTYETRIQVLWGCDTLLLSE